jgi:hypothetical protein
MKPLIPKLKKEYTLNISPFIDYKSNEKGQQQLAFIKEPTFYSITYRYPTEKLSKSYIAIPAAIFNIYRKNLNFFYRPSEIDHKNSLINYELFKVDYLFLHNVISKFNFNINLALKTEKLEINAKVLLNKLKEKKCSLSIRKNIRKVLTESLDHHYDNLLDVLADVINNQFSKKLITKVPLEYHPFIKSIVLINVVQK